MNFNAGPALDQLKGKSKLEVGPDKAVKLEGVPI